MKNLDYNGPDKIVKSLLVANARQFSSDLCKASRLISPADMKQILTLRSITKILSDNWNQFNIDMAY